LGNVLLNGDQISAIVRPVRNAVELGKEVLDNNPQIFSSSERRQYALLERTWRDALEDVDQIDETISEQETAGRLLRLGRLGLSMARLAPLLI